MKAQDSYALYRRYADQIDTLRMRSEWLNDKDKALIQMVFDKGSTFEQIARLTGQNPSTVSRRCHRLVRRLIGHQRLPAFHRAAGLNSRELRIAQEYFLKGLTQKAIARKFGLSLYRVSTVLKKARRVDAQGQPGASPSTGRVDKYHHQASKS